MNENNKTLKGYFRGNKVFCDDGSIENCYTFGINRVQIDNKKGYFNIRKNSSGTWIIYQFILDEN